MSSASGSRHWDQLKDPVEVLRSTGLLILSIFVGLRPRHRTNLEYVLRFLEICPLDVQDVVVAMIHIFVHPHLANDWFGELLKRVLVPYPMSAMVMLPSLARKTRTFLIFRGASSLRSWLDTDHASGTRHRSFREILLRRGCSLRQSWLRLATMELFTLGILKTSSSDRPEVGKGRKKSEFSDQEIVVDLERMVCFRSLQTNKSGETHTSFWVISIRVAFCGIFKKEQECQLSTRISGEFGWVYDIEASHYHRLVAMGIEHGQIQLFDVRESDGGIRSGPAMEVRIPGSLKSAKWLPGGNEGIPDLLLGCLQSGGVEVFDVRKCDSGPVAAWQSSSSESPHGVEPIDQRRVAISTIDRCVFYQASDGKVLHTDKLEEEACERRGAKFIPPQLSEETDGRRNRDVEERIGFVVEVVAKFGLCGGMCVDVVFMNAVAVQLWKVLVTAAE